MEKNVGEKESETLSRDVFLESKTVEISPTLSHIVSIYLIQKELNGFIRWYFKVVAEQ